MSVAEMALSLYSPPTKGLPARCRSQQECMDFEAVPCTDYMQDRTHAELLAQDQPELATTTPRFEAQLEERVSRSSRRRRAW